jgi:hypothetical protein
LQKPGPVKKTFFLPFFSLGSINLISEEKFSDPPAQKNKKKPITIAGRQNPSFRHHFIPNVFIN